MGGIPVWDQNEQGAETRSCSGSGNLLLGLTDVQQRFISIEQTIEGNSISHEQSHSRLLD